MGVSDSNAKRTPPAIPEAAAWLDGGAAHGLRYRPAGESVQRSARHDGPHGVDGRPFADGSRRSTDQARSERPGPELDRHDRPALQHQAHGLGRFGDAFDDHPGTRCPGLDWARLQRRDLEGICACVRKSLQTSLWPEALRRLLPGRAAYPRPRAPHVAGPARSITAPAGTRTTFSSTALANVVRVDRERSGARPATRARGLHGRTRNLASRTRPSGRSESSGRAI